MDQDQSGDRMPEPDTGPKLGSGLLDQQGQNPRIITSTEQKRAFRQAQRHSRRVFVLKWSLPVIALGIVAGFVSWVSWQKPAEDPIEAKLEAESLKQDELVMQNPNLNGFTDGRSYEVVADQATQKVDTPNVINLTSVRARITDEKQEWVAIDADSGVFDQNKETLGLDGGVKVNSSLGYKLNTDKVSVDMPKGYMETLSEVNIASKDIRLSASKLEAINNGEQFRFSGNVRLYIDAALMNKASGQKQALTKQDAASEVPPPSQALQGEDETQ
nr:LPS export ABC transporter periplasmic protein LptC [uncultured Cohaesibacter sp.]